MRSTILTLTSLSAPPVANLKQEAPLWKSTLSRGCLLCQIISGVVSFISSSSSTILMLAIIQFAFVHELTLYQACWKSVNTSTNEMY